MDERSPAVGWSCLTVAVIGIILATIFTPIPIDKSSFVQPLIGAWVLGLIGGISLIGLIMHYLGL